ncbi:MAG TPA: phosphatidylserine decarboxylase [Thermoplasmata archaeon]|nr:phosphatidylserine decarboxylase [Thermoplasmata archaeon]
MFVRPARPYLAVGAAGLVLLWSLLAFLHDRPFVALVGAVGLTGLWAFFALFFRDPERVPGEGAVSAADGRVTIVAEEDGRWRIAVFMNVTDVHVNRFPLDAAVVAIDDTGEGFRPAFAVDASHNVQRRYRLETRFGPMEVIQMTGMVARRLVSLVRPSEDHRKGDRLGMILLGSRVDVLLPVGAFRPAVKPGDRVRAGTSTIAVERS